MVIRDKVRQVSRGFGFVTYENPIDAEEAVKHMDSKVRLEPGVYCCLCSCWIGLFVEPRTSPSEWELYWLIVIFQTKQSGSQFPDWAFV